MQGTFNHSAMLHDRSVFALCQIVAPGDKAKAGSMTGVQFFRMGFKAFLKDESGAAAIEYGLIVAGIAMALIPFLPNLKNYYENMFTSFSTTINNMMP